MKNLLKLLLGALLSIGTLQAQEIAGRWDGVLSVQGINLRLIFHIHKTDTGFVSTLDSPDQGSTGFPVEKTSFDGSSLTLLLSNIGARYEGELQSDSIVGRFTQYGTSYPMTLVKGSDAGAATKPLPLHSLSENIVSEIKTITLQDGEEITGRLCLPKNRSIQTIVVAVHGTGPYTYLTKRQGFNYYDLLADGFCESGVGFFTYNRRGVDLGESAPWYDEVDSIKYANYLPCNEAGDIETMVAFLRNDSRFNECRIILYGISEGTIIASMVAERNKVKIDALFLHGYAHENMYDIIAWQNSGEGVMVMANSIFDKNDDKAIDEQEYASEEPTIAAYRRYLFKDMPFESVDQVKNKLIDIADMRKMRGAFHQMLMRKIADNEGHWIWNNYFRVSIDWLKQHFALEPNKTRLLRVETPIYLFHGREDANVPAESVHDLEIRFEACGKSNLKTFLFDHHNHDLNIQDWFATKVFSEGLQKIFNTAAEI